MNSLKKCYSLRQFIERAHMCVKRTSRSYLNQSIQPTSDQKLSGRLQMSALNAEDWVSSQSGVLQEYCITSIFRLHWLLGLHYSLVLCYEVQLPSSWSRYATSSLSLQYLQLTEFSESNARMTLGPSMLPQTALTS